VLVLSFGLLSFSTCATPCCCWLLLHSPLLASNLCCIFIPCCPHCCCLAFSTLSLAQLAFALRLLLAVLAAAASWRCCCCRVLAGSLQFPLVASQPLCVCLPLVLQRLMKSKTGTRHTQQAFMLAPSHVAQLEWPARCHMMQDASPELGCLKPWM